MENVKREGGEEERKRTVVTVQGQSVTLEIFVSSQREAMKT